LVLRRDRTAEARASLYFGAATDTPRSLAGESGSWPGPTVIRRGHAEWRATERAVVSNGVSNHPGIPDG
jgi:hypothetical protein